MGKAIAAFCGALMIAGAAVAEDDWSSFWFSELVDPLTDEITWQVAARSERVSLDKVVAIQCWDQKPSDHIGSWVMFMDGKHRFRLVDLPEVRVQVRFDKNPVKTVMGFANSDGRAAMVIEKADVAMIAEALRSSSRMVFRIEDGRPVVLPLRESTAAMSKMDEACPWLRPQGN